MKSFKEYYLDSKLPNYEWCTIEAESEVIHILFDNRVESFLNEAKTKGIPVGGPYSIRFDKVPVNMGDDHIHAYERNNELFALNVGGTAHDNSHGVRIPNRLAKAINKYFPGIKLPKDNLIESAPKAVNLLADAILLESFRKA